MCKKKTHWVWKRTKQEQDQYSKWQLTNNHKNNTKRGDSFFLYLKNNFITHFKILCDLSKQIDISNIYKNIFFHKDINGFTSRAKFCISYFIFKNTKILWSLGKIKFQDGPFIFIESKRWICFKGRNHLLVNRK